MENISFKNYSALPSAKNNQGLQHPYSQHFSTILVSSLLGVNHYLANPGRCSIVVRYCILPVV
jgi:hypothetical protein